MILLAACLGSTWGCGSRVPESNLVGAAPHGGVSFAFTNKKGSVEIGSETAPPGAAGVSKQNSHQIFAYFYGPDGTTPLAPPPTDVKISLGSDAVIPLTLKEEGGKTGRFATAPGPYSEPPRGTLTANIGGEEIIISFALR